MLLALALGVFGAPARAATGRVVKVLPMFLDAKGRTGLSPSLYERDAYQNFLRLNPEKQSGMVFKVQCKLRGTAKAPLKLKLELRGILEGRAPKQTSLESPPAKDGWFGSWTEIKFTGKPFTEFGELTAWRATLWEGETMLAEQQSFLW